MPYAVDLFCGAGGMSEGLLQAGFKIIFSSDINIDVEKTYTNRHAQLGYLEGVHTTFQRADVRNLNGEDILQRINNLEIFSDSPLSEIDALFGGPPCQGFSRAGKRNANDPRNLLFKEYLRIVHELNPRYVVMENVEGFMDTVFHDFIGVNNNVYEKEYAPIILRKEFSNIGYQTLDPVILDASDFGVPQRRKRVIFIAYRKDQIAPQYPLPKSDVKISLKDALSDLASSAIIANKVRLTSYQQSSINGRTPNIEGKPIKSIKRNNVDLSNHTKIITERFSLYREGEDSTVLRKRIQNQGIDISNCPNLINLCAKHLNLQAQNVINLFMQPQNNSQYLDILLTKKVIRTRLDSSSPSPTVVTLPDDYISPFEDRVLSVREMARLQSFDDSFVFLGKRTTGGQRRRYDVPQYTQVGNAVPPLLAKAIAAEIMKMLR